MNENRKKTVTWILLCLAFYGAGYLTNDLKRNKAEKERLCRLIGWGISEGYLLVDTNRFHPGTADNESPDVDNADAADSLLDALSNTNNVARAGLK